MIYKSSEDYQPEKKRRGKGWIVALVIVVVIAVAAFFCVKYVQNEVAGDRFKASETVIIDIPEGATADTISQLLKDEGIIRNKFIFRNWLRFFYTGSPQFNYGPHELSNDMSFEEIIPKLEEPMMDLRETITLQFIDGWTALRMGMYLEEKEICTVDEWLAACNDIYDVSFYDRISDNPDKFVKLEGFLYPDTYEFFEDVTPRDIVQRMLETFDMKVLQDTDLKAQIDASEYSLEEIVTLASIIQKETEDEAEIYKVSSVFQNRLAPNSSLPSLQSCATRNYVWYVIEYYYEDLNGAEAPEQMCYEYNTYESEGLMIGAICNPNSLAIRAMLNPEDTPYYYFLMDDTGKTYYGETYSDHLANIREMQSVNASVAGGIGEMD